MAQAFAIYNAGTTPELSGWAIDEPNWEEETATKVCDCFASFWASIQAIFQAIGRAFRAVFISPFLGPDPYIAVRAVCDVPPVALSTEGGPYSSSMLALLQLIANVKGAEDLLRGFGSLEFALEAIPGLKEAVAADRELMEIIEAEAPGGMGMGVSRAIREGVSYEEAIEQIDGLKEALRDPTLRYRSNAYRAAFQELSAFLAAYHGAQMEAQQQVAPHMARFIARFLRVCPDQNVDLHALILRLSKLPFSGRGGMLETKTTFFASARTRGARLSAFEEALRVLELNFSSGDARVPEALGRAMPEGGGEHAGARQRPHPTISRKSRSFVTAEPTSFISLPVGQGDAACTVDRLLQAYFTPENQGKSHWVRSRGANDWRFFEERETRRVFKEFPDSLFLGLDRMVTNPLERASYFSSAPVRVPLKMRLPEPAGSGVQPPEYVLSAAITAVPKGDDTDIEYVFYVKEEGEDLAEPVWLECRGDQVRLIPIHELRPKLTQSAILHYDKLPELFAPLPLPV